MDVRSLLDNTFENANIIIHPKFEDEFLSLIIKTGEEELIIEILKRLLMVMKSYGNNMYEHKKIEKLKKCKNISSLHIDTKNNNLRVLFSRLHTGEILLHTFYERQGKKRTEYQSHIPEALSRLTEYIQKR